MNKKILGSSVAIVAAVGLLGGGTFAAFSHFDTVEDNQLAAGTLQVRLSDGQGEEAVPLAFENLRPGDSQTISVGVTNAGTGSGDATLWFTDLVTDEAGAALADQLEITVGNQREGRVIPGTRDRECGLDGQGNYQHLRTASLADVGATPIDLLNGGLRANPLRAGDQSCVVITATFLDLPDTTDERGPAYATSVNNDAQGGSVTFDLVFRLDQS